MLITLLDENDTLTNKIPIIFNCDNPCHFNHLTQLRGLVQVTTDYASFQLSRYFWSTYFENIWSGCFRGQWDQKRPLGQKCKIWSLKWGRICLWFLHLNQNGVLDEYRNKSSQKTKIWTRFKEPDFYKPWCFYLVSLGNSRDYWRSAENSKAR